MATNSPRHTEKLTPASARTSDSPSPYTLVRFWTSMRGLDLPIRLGSSCSLSRRGLRARRRGAGSRAGFRRLPSRRRFAVSVLFRCRIGAFFAESVVVRGGRALPRAGRIPAAGPISGRRSRMEKRSVALAGRSAPPLVRRRGLPAPSAPLLDTARRSPDRPAARLPLVISMFLPSESPITTCVGHRMPVPEQPQRHLGAGRAGHRLSRGRPSGRLRDSGAEAPAECGSRALRGVGAARGL